MKVGQAESAAGLLRTFANPHRLSILEVLRQRGEQSVGEILGRTAGLSQSRLSNELARLRQHGLVRRRVDGKRRIYRLADGRAALILALLESLV